MSDSAWTSVVTQDPDDKVWRDAASQAAHMAALRREASGPRTVDIDTAAAELANVVEQIDTLNRRAEMLRAKIAQQKEVRGFGGSNAPMAAARPAQAL